MENLPGLIVIVGVALLMGMFIGVLTSKLLATRHHDNSDLEKQVAEAGANLRAYRQEVSDHYVKTSLLVSELTESYRELHNHLAEGASDLLDTRGVQPLMRSIPSREQLDAIPEPASQRVLPPLDYAPKTSPSEKGVLDESFGLDKPAPPGKEAAETLEDFFNTTQLKPSDAKTRP